jgi:signal transduction histidine kinase/ligand-binding sensor domain-containing protein/DNA-binding response OmpR family regulator
MKTDIRNTILILLLIISSIHTVNSQDLQISFKTITTGDGLADNNIHSIIQDSKGFMWFGSEEGLHRYDGYNLKVYRQNTDGTGLSGNFIRALYEDRFGRIWIGTNMGGITIIDPATGKFYYIRHNPQDLEHTLLSDEIYCFSESRNGGLWVGTKTGLTYLNINSDKNSPQIITSTKHYKHDPNVPNSLAYPHVYSVLEDKEGVLWAGTSDGGLSKLLPGADSFINYKPDNKNPGAISGLGIMCVYEDSKHNIWIGTWARGLNLYDRKTDSFIKFHHSHKDTTSLSHENVYSICEDQYENLWIATYEGGINKLIVGKNGNIKFQRYASHTNELMSFYKNRVKVIYADRSCSLWAGTIGNGITQISQVPVNFRHIISKSSNVSGLRSNTINCVYQISIDTVLAGTGNGLLKMIWKPSDNPKQFRFTPLIKDSLSAPALYTSNVTTVTRDSKGYYWAGTSKNGLFRIIFENDGKRLRSVTRFSNSRPAPYNMHGKEIISVFEHKGIIFSVTKFAVNYFSRKKKQFIWKNENNKPIFTLSGYPTTAYIDDNDVLYVGTFYDGMFIYKLNFDNGEVTASKPEKVSMQSGQLSLSSNNITSINKGPDGKLWVSTIKGLNLIDLEKKTRISFKEKDGLPSAGVTQIFSDNKGYYWFGTIQGLGRMDMTSMNISPFYMPGGFLPNYFSPSPVNLINGKLAFLPTRKGIWYFYPDSIKTNPFLARPVITDIQISGQSIEPGVKINGRKIINGAVDNTNKIILRHNENVLKFEFSGLTYYKQNLNKYAYMLEGLEKEWNYTNAKHRTVTYSNLSPQEYVFKVKAANSDGIWNPEEASLTIIIKPPFYKTWWAYTLYILIFLTGIFTIPRFVINRVRLQENLKQEKIAREKETALNQMKLKFFTNISHEFRTPLSLISGPLNELLSDKTVKSKKTREHLEMMKRNSDRLLRLINQLMDFRKVMQGNMKLSVRQGDLSAFVKQTADTFMAAAVQKQVNFHTDIEPREDLCWFDHEKIETILFNLLSNAFKYTPKNGNILLELSYRDNYACITVSDSGPGIREEERDRIFNRFYQSQYNQEQVEAGTGIGLSLVKDFIEMHKGSVSLSYTEEQKGASFKIKIGIAKEMFMENDLTENDDHADNVIIKEHLSAAKESTTAPEDEDNNKPLILIVEDNPDVRQYLKNILSPYFRIETAANGVKGVELASATLPSLILSDVMMPEMDGFKFCKKVKENFLTSHIPVILLTALEGNESKVEGIEQGADAFISKPFDKKVLLSQINNLIQSRKKLKERFTEQWDFVEDIATSSSDKLFIKRAAKLVEEKMHDPQFNVSEMVKEMKVSRTLLHMKLRELTGQSTSEFIRTIRLKQAAKLLKQGDMNISEVTYAVGFNDPKYFSKSFKNLFGLTPTQFQKGDASSGIKVLLDDEDD